MDIELLKASQELAATIGGALAAKPLLERLLGPSFDSVGKSMVGLLERFGNRNLADIFKRSAEKVQAPGLATGVNPRVLRAVIEDGSFADDIISREYYAGLLASAGDCGGNDDTCVTFLAIVRDLTAAQIKLHHLLYSCFRTRGHEIRQRFRAGDSIEVFLGDLALKDFGIAYGEIGKTHLFAGLAREMLIEPSYHFGQFAIVPGEGIQTYGTVLRGSSLGAQLFLWVHGRTTSIPDDLFSTDEPLVDWMPAQVKWFLTASDLADLKGACEDFHTMDYAAGHPRKSREDVEEMIRAYLTSDICWRFISGDLRRAFSVFLEKDGWTVDDWDQLRGLLREAVMFTTGTAGTQCA